MKGVIEKIRAFPEKGKPGKDLAEGRFTENQGLEGDFHADRGDRQISLLFAEIRELLESSKEKGYCFSRFKENVSIRGMSPAITMTGMRITAGEVILEITREVKNCHDECFIFKAGKRCPLAGQNLFARVAKGGIMRAGDRVESC